jgi:hypothetical protein
VFIVHRRRWALRSASRISDIGGKHMVKHLALRAVRITRWFLAVGRSVVEALRSSVEKLRYQDVRVPIEVLAASGTRRRTIEHELRAGLRQLQRILGDLPRPDIAIVVQHVILTDRQLAGCSQLGHRPNGTPYVLWRLALQVNGRPLGSDELLAVLAEQWIALANQQNGPSVLVPVDFEPQAASLSRPSPTLRPDPFMPHGDGANRHRAG